jgi:mRNA interferase MazF
MTLTKSRLERGDIVVAAFPFTDLSGNKRRPALVISSDVSQNDVTLAFISSVVPQRPMSDEILLVPTAPDSQQTGLKVPSVLRLNKLATIERNLITRWIGRLAPSRYAEIDDVLTKTLGIDLTRYLIVERKRLSQILTTNGLDALQKALQAG